MSFSSSILYLLEVKLPFDLVNRLNGLSVIFSFKRAGSSTSMLQSVSRPYCLLV